LAKPETKILSKSALPWFQKEWLGRSNTQLASHQLESILRPQLYQAFKYSWKGWDGEA